MNVTIEQANDAKRKLLALNEYIKGPPLFTGAVLILGDTGFRIEVKRTRPYNPDLIPTEIDGVPVVSL